MNQNEIMNIVFIGGGFLGGFILAYIIFNLIYKTKSVSKSVFDALQFKQAETNTLLKVEQEKFSSSQMEYAKFTAKNEAAENELKELREKSSALIANAINNEQRIIELNATATEQTSLNRKLQDETTGLNQRLSEETAKNNGLSESLKQVKETNIVHNNNLLRQGESIRELTAENSTYQAKLASLTENHQSLKENNSGLNEQVAQLTAVVNKLTSERSTLTANNAALTEKLATQKEEMIEIQRTAHYQFEKIANQILEEKSGKFTEANKTNIEALLKPLGENIENFKKKVEDTYDKESNQRFSLEEKVKELVEQTNKVSNEANNLANALKGQAKKQGNWGEMILESILQKSGLVRDREYFLQQTIKDEEGKNLRPDVLVKLPDNRIIIIDSKVSLTAYDRFSSAETVEEQAKHLLDHLKSIYSHVDDLHGKKYDNLEASLDFTMMFVPIEPAYLISIQHDQELWAYAYAKRILLISPTNLIACLKLISDLWKRELQSKNAMEIVKRGELLYEKFVAFTNTLDEVGKHINRTQQSYTVAINQLNSGSGHLVGQALKLKNLGLKSNKEMPVSLMPTDYEPDEVAEPKLLDENNEQIE